MSSLTMILIQHSAIKFASDTKWPVTCDRSVVFSGYSSSPHQ